MKPKTLKEQLAETRERFNKQQAELVRKHKLLKGLAGIIGDYEPPFVHHSRLYGAVGSISFRSAFAESLREGNPPDRELFRALLEKVPPVARYRIKGGCLSFRPIPEGYDPEKDPKNDKATELWEIHGILVDIEPHGGPHQSPRASFEWYGYHQAELWKFEIAFPLHQTRLGALDMSAKRWGRYGPVRSWDRCRFLPAPALSDFIVTRWAAGAPEYPNRFTLSVDPDTGGALDWPALVKVEGEEEGGKDAATANTE